MCRDLGVDFQGIVFGETVVTFCDIVCRERCVEFYVILCGRSL